MSDNNNSKERLTFDLPQSHKEALDKMAEEEDVSVAHLLRRAVKKLLGGK